MTLAAAIVIAAGFGLLATETVRFGGGDRPTLAGAVRAEPSATTSSSTTTTLPGRPCRSPLTDPDPLRLWVGGDSLAGSLGPSLGTIAGATGVVQPYFDSRVSSGLTNPTFFDWPRQAEKEMARLNPEIAVFIIGANDYLAPTTRRSTTGTGTATSTTTTGDDAWKADYANRVEAMLTTLSAPERTVIWVGPPPFKNDRDNDGIEQINEVSKEVIARHPDAVFVDDYAMFLDEKGKYTDKLPDENGNVITVRSGDGVHFTTEGGNLLARAVYKLVDAQCRVIAQRVPGVTKVTIQTQGSTLVAPGSNNRQGDTIATTPPATAPSTTAPPTTTAPPAPTTTAPPATIVPIITRPTFPTAPKT
ncbi:MAG: DUF459 domain-containing protein [Acidimicrobiia bacterium]